jgi:hypothetical protein
LNNQALVHQNFAGQTPSGITSALKYGEQIIFGDLHGNLHLFNPDGSVVDIDLFMSRKTTNTIWWLGLDAIPGRIRVAHCNGTFTSFAIKTGT